MFLCGIESDEENELTNNCNFKKIVIPVILTALALMTFSVCDTPAKARKPNVIIFYVDDMGWVGLGSYGCDFIDTPEIDKLASEGVRFTNAYSPAPNCSPSRASLLTGLYPPRHGITQYLPGNIKRFKDKPLTQADLPPGLDPKFTTMAEVFKAAGYTTVSMGKWHLGGPEFYPERHGFDLNMGGTKEGHQSVFPPYQRIGTALVGKPEEHITEALLRHALDFIDQNVDRPFFFYVPFFSVHNPRGGSRELHAKYAERFPGDKARIDYAAMTEGLDRFVGGVRAKLKEEGIEKDTIFVFSSDNGGDYVPTCEGLRNRKGYIYEGGIRVPCIIAGRGIQAGRVSDTPINQIDLFPTLLSLAGLTPPEVDGVSLRPILEGTGDIAERDLFWHYPHYANSGGLPGSVIRSGDYKLIHWYEDDTWELFNLRENLAETTNIADDFPERTAAMRRKLEDWLRETGAVIPRRR
jgi:arylsulfatase A